MRTLIAVSAVALLGACQIYDPPPGVVYATPPEPAPAPTPARDLPPNLSAPSPATAAVPRLAASSDCGASQMQQHVGGPIPDPFPAGDNPMRIYRAGDPVPQDNNQRRMNIELDASGSRIVSITCG
jgi:hypothetical protein